jgi:hypothetical protein
VKSFNMEGRQFISYCISTLNILNPLSENVQNIFNKTDNAENSLITSLTQRKSILIRNTYFLNHSSLTYIFFFRETCSYKFFICFQQHSLCDAIHASAFSYEFTSFSFRILR